MFPGFGTGLIEHRNAPLQVWLPEQVPSALYPTSHEQHWPLNFEAVNPIADQLEFWHWSDKADRSPVTWMDPEHLPCLSHFEKLPDPDITPDAVKGWPCAVEAFPP